MSVRVDHGGNKCNVHHGEFPYAYTDYTPHTDERPCDKAKFELNEHPCRFGHHCGMGVVTGDKSKCECAPSKPFDFKYEHLRNARDTRGAPHYGAKVVDSTAGGITTLAQGEESSSVTTLAVGEESGSGRVAGGITTQALGEESAAQRSAVAADYSQRTRGGGSSVTTLATGEEDPASGVGLTTLAVGEEAAGAAVAQMFAQSKK